MVRPARSRIAVLVVPAAVLAGHGLGYALAGSAHSASHTVDHGYIPTAAAMAAPALVAALLWAVGGVGWRGARPPADGPSVAFLVAAQWALFVAQELVEHAVAGEVSAVVRSPALWFGLAAQVAVASATALLLRAASWVGAHAVALPVAHRRPLGAAPTGPWTSVARPRATLVLATVSSRGPPRQHR